jgi:3-isopropylmalate dehydrogenase
MDFLVLPGDGIGPEIVAVAVEALAVLDRRHALGIRLHERDNGLSSLARTGTTLPDDIRAMARQADGILLGPVSTDAYPSAAEGGINVSAWCRKELDLYANIRPSRVRPGVPAAVDAMDLVIVRENMALGSGEFKPTDDVALAVGKATTQGCRRIAVAAFELARRRRRHVTAVHKANVLRIFSGMFLDQAASVAREYPDVTFDTAIVDAMAALLVRRPASFDVVVTTNMFGDILSDEAAELSGGLGLAASLNVGDRHAVAQAAHGSAPDIAGQDRANPVAFLESVAMLLLHLGARAGGSACADAGAHLRSAIDRLLAQPHTRTVDLGGPLGTRAFGAAVAAALCAE